MRGMRCEPAFPVWIMCDADGCRRRNSPKRHSWRKSLGARLPETPPGIPATSGSDTMADPESSSRLENTLMILDAHHYNVAGVRVYPAATGR